MGIENKTIFLFLALSCVLVFTFVSCGDDKKSIESQTPPAVKLKIGYIPIIDCAQIYVASQFGFFAKVGLDVELVPMTGGPAIIQALSAEAIDIGFANLATVVFYEQTAPPLKRLAGGTRMDKDHSEAGLIVLADSDIQNISGLKGKTIAVNSRRNIVDLAVLRAIKSIGLSAKDISLVEVPFKDMEIALRSKRIDVATLPEPLLSLAMKTGGVRDLGDHFAIAFGEVYSTGYFSMAKSNKMIASVIRKFNTAIDDATKALSTPNEKTFRAISYYTKHKQDILEMTGRPEFVINIPESAFEQMQSWLEEEKLLKKK